MGLYYIVRKGGPPGKEGSANLDVICAAWSQSQDKASTEIVETDLAGRVIRRLSSAESERIALEYRKLAS